MISSPLSVKIIYRLINMLTPVSVCVYSIFLLRIFLFAFFKTTELHVFWISLLLSFQVIRRVHGPFCDLQMEPVTPNHSRALANASSVF